MDALADDPFAVPGGNPARAQKDLTSETAVIIAAASGELGKGDVETVRLIPTQAVGNVAQQQAKLRSQQLLGGGVFNGRVCISSIVSEGREFSGQLVRDRTLYRAQIFEELFIA